MTTGQFIIKIIGTIFVLPLLLATINNKYLTTTGNKAMAFIFANGALIAIWI